MTFDGPFFDVLREHAYRFILYGGAVLVTLYLAYLAWMRPDDYLEATAVGVFRPMPEKFRIFMGRYMLPASTLLWIGLFYIAFTM